MDVQNQENKGVVNGHITFDVNSIGNNEIVADSHLSKLHPFHRNIKYGDENCFPLNFLSLNFRWLKVSLQ